MATTKYRIFICTPTILDRGRSVNVVAADPREAFDIGSKELKDDLNEMIFEIMDDETGHFVYDIYNDFYE